MESEDIALIIIGVIIAIGVIAESTIIILSFVYADKIDCNLLWCTFTTERQSIESSSSISQDCYINGVQVNCSDFKDRFADSWYHGWHTSSGGILGECIIVHNCPNGETFCNNETKCPNGIPQNIQSIA